MWWTVLIIYPIFLFLVTWVTGQFIGWLLTWSRVDIKEGSAGMGSKIGYVERLLIFIFVILNQYEAIGFLVAAKSILRFNESRDDKKYAEYVLYGTLLSVLLAIVIGIAAKETIHFFQ